jgi:Tfp pilus assembly protein PilF
MDISILEKLLAAGQDNLMLRFGLGNACLQQGDYGNAVEHLRAALRHDPAHSASHKLLGKALAAAGRNDEAVAAYEAGIRSAEEKGDIQAAKEMKVFLKRLQKPAAP